MAFVFFMTLPGLVVALVVLTALDRLGLLIRGRSGLPWHRDGHRLASAVALDELQAAFHSGKRHAIEQRSLALVLRDDEGDGAPGRMNINVAGRRATITLPPRDPVTP